MGYRIEAQIDQSDAGLVTLYGADVSATLLSKVTDAVIEQVVEWQYRPLDAVYPIVYLYCIVVKIRRDNKVINKTFYWAVGVNIKGHKELLGLWLWENEGAKFWLNVLTDQNRGVKDILIACVALAILPQQLLSFEAATYALTDQLYQVFQLVFARCLDASKLGWMVVPMGVHLIQKQNVEMGIQIPRTTEALY